MCAVPAHRLVGSFERLRVDDGDTDEDDAREMVREHAKKREESVTSESAISADEQHRDRLLRIGIARAVVLEETFRRAPRKGDVGRARNG